MKAVFTLTRRMAPWVCAVVALLVVAAAGYHFVAYGLPMLTGRYEAASESEYAGDRAKAFHNLGITAYRRHDYSTARQMFEKALSASLEDGGKLSRSSAERQGWCYFWIGNCDYNQGKFETAAAAYERALELDPANRYAKYNLEKLQDTDKSGGDGGKPGQPKKRI